MNYFSKYFSDKAVKLYVQLLLVISLLAFSHVLPLLWMIMATFTVLFFFSKGNSLTLCWYSIPKLTFRKKLFATALVFRLIWVVISYFLYLSMTGQPFEFSTADAAGYHKEAIWIMELMRDGQWDVFWSYYKTRLSDMGYPVCLILVYSVFDQSIFMARVVKAVLSAVTVVLIYKLTVRNFGERTGRVAGILAMLFPNLIYYTGLHVKETEMVFFLMLFVERSDALIRQRNVKFLKLLWVLFLGAISYFFRAVLAYTVFLSFLTVLIFSEQKIFKYKRKLRLVLSSFIVILALSGSVVITEAAQYWETRMSNQTVSLEHRTQTNTLAKYGSAAVFAPLIVIAPFPTFVNIETQQNHMLMSGGYFVKNIMAFFVFVALLSLLKKKRWRRHVLILTIFVGYLAILAMSKFAFVERFHMPALPFHIILTAYGISQIRKRNIKHFKYYLVFIAIVIIGWNWFKLAGRGII